MMGAGSSPSNCKWGPFVLADVEPSEGSPGFLEHYRARLAEFKAEAERAGMTHAEYAERMTLP